MITEKKTDIKSELLKYEKAVDKMYWIFLVFILMYELLGSTPFLLYFTQWYAGLFQNTSAELAAMLYQSMMNLRFLIIIPAIYNIIMKTQNGKEKLILSAMLLLGWYYSLRMREQNDTYIFRDMAMIVASYGKDYKKICRYAFWLAGGIMALTVSMNLLGVIPEWNLERDGAVRHSFGTLGPTNLAGHVCFAIMAYMFIKDGLLKWQAYVVIVVLSVLNLMFVDGRTAFLSVFLGTVGCIVYTVFVKKKWNLPAKADRIWRGILLVSYPVSCGIFMLMMITYNPSPEGVYNKYHILGSLEGRVANAKRIMGVTGVTPFGRYYENYWVAGNTFKNTGNYEFLDSSYARVLLMYGWVAFVLILGLLILLQCRLYKEKQTFKMYLLAVLSLHFMMEHHILEPAYNIFLILPFAQLPVIVKNTKRSKEKT